VHDAPHHNLRSRLGLAHAAGQSQQDYRADQPRYHADLKVRQRSAGDQDYSMSFTRNRRGGATAIWTKFREVDDTPECQVNATPTARIYSF
jgi:hypothetical protein